LDAEIRVLMLPDGLDPDELILQDRERWDRLVDEALPVADYFFQLVFQEEDISTARGKRQAVDRLDRQGEAASGGSVAARHCSNEQPC